MKNLFVVFVGILGFWLFNYGLHSNDHYIQSEAAFNQIVGKTSEQLGKKYSMSLSSVGGSENKEGISLISVTFSRCRGMVPKEEGRKMIIDCVEEFLFAVNTDKKIRSLLKNFPFTPKNLEIGIINLQLNGEDLFDPEIEVFSSAQGKVFYDTRDPDDPFKYKSETSEPYEEALAIVRKEQQQALIDREL